LGKSRERERERERGRGDGEEVSVDRKMTKMKRHRITNK